MFMERTFAERLQDAMRQRGFKQVDLVREADKYGVKLGKSHMSQYVSGNSSFSGKLSAGRRRLAFDGRRRQPDGRRKYHP